MDDRRDIAIILDLIEAAENIVAFTAGTNKSTFAAEAKSVSAVSFQVAILGEAVKKLSANLQRSHPEIPWRKIAGMRDRLIHGYNGIDVEEVWTTAVRDVPVLLKQLRQIQTDLGI